MRQTTGSAGLKFYATPFAYYEYKLCRFFGCLPSQLERENAESLEMMWEIMQLEEEERFLNQKRADQRTK